ncbi:pyridoxal phosphate-dependent aminotransferase family protein [bacterium]|nr:pyridoxal phosphate-dependent aminotransferase family protein [bacterium]MBT6996189.1 pyridoxal phosphate-dependent aminotransferase family protein [bacterium]
MKRETERIDSLGIAKRQENIIEKFGDEKNPHAIIDGKPFLIANSNDYLGLRHHPIVKKSEIEASEKYGAGPGAVRFISGSLKIYRDLEKRLAQFHGRDDAMIFSSGFAANLAALYCLCKGISRDALVTSDVLVISDELNHRSIIDGIRLANLPKEQRKIFSHLDADDLKNILEESSGTRERVIVVTDGVFSMLGELQNLKEIREVIDQCQHLYPLGITLMVDDCHGVGISGKTGRGTEEIFDTQADVLVGTLGKALGSDGGYIVADQTIIDYLRESSATYIYSNNISPGSAGAALAAINIVDSPEGKKLLESSRANTEYFQEKLKQSSFSLAAPSTHPIQPVLIGDTQKTKKLVDGFYDHGILVTNISYPVVPKGRDEIRIQISATHTTDDIEKIVRTFQNCQ